MSRYTEHQIEQVEDFLRNEFEPWIRVLDNALQKESNLVFTAEWDVRFDRIFIETQVIDEDGKVLATENHVFRFEHADDCLLIDIPTVK